KTVRNTGAPAAGEGKEVKLFSAMLHAEAIVIAQLRVPDDTTEITQVAALLAGIDLTGVVVTADALCRARHKASYEDLRVMPTPLLGGAGGGGVSGGGVGIITGCRGRL
ncbi:MAG TPA: hypothetical protein VF788_00100, partial [Pseudonocardiaceae bacterium]